MILLAPKIPHQSLVAAQLPLSSFGAALDKSIEDAPCDLRDLGRSLKVTSEGRRQNSCGHGLTSKQSALKPFSVPLFSLGVR